MENNNKNDNESMYIDSLEEKQEKLLEKYIRTNKCIVKNCDTVKMQLQNLINTDVDYRISVASRRLLEKLEKINIDEIEVDRKDVDNLHKISYELI